MGDAEGDEEKALLAVLHCNMGACYLSLNEHEKVIWLKSESSMRSISLPARSCPIAPLHSS